MWHIFHICDATPVIVTYTNTPRPRSRSRPPQVADLKAEVSRLKGQLDDTESARAKAVAAVEVQRDAAVERQECLSEDLRRARQAAERQTVSEEDAVIAVEKDMRAKHEKEVAALRERAGKAEERVSARMSF